MREIVKSLLLAIVGACLSLMTPAEAGAQTNLGFESGLKGWTLSSGKNGRIAVERDHIYQGRACARITGYGRLAMRVNATPLSIVRYNCYVSSERAGVKIYPFIRFFDSNDALLLEYKSQFLTFAAWQPVANFTEIPPDASWMEIGLETDTSKAASQAIVYADQFSITSEAAATVSMTPAGALPVKYRPPYNVGGHMNPFWHSDTVYDETVLLYSSRNKTANGKLLYMPDKILSVKSLDGKIFYSPRKDFTLEENTISRVENSGIPYTADTFFTAGKDFAWYNLQSKWIVVTYTHKDTWEEAAPGYKGDQMPNTLEKLNAGTPLNIVAFGTGIPRGMHCSGYDDIPPYMPSYPELFVDQLEKQYGNKSIRLFNAGLPGAQVDWGAAYADKYVNPLKPDLVVLDFGIHDCWKYPPDDFREFIGKIIRKIRDANPRVEFVLISDMLYDPGFARDDNDKKGWFLSNARGYYKALQSLDTTGIISLDMTTLSDTIYQRKKPKDCLNNPLYPNDYLTRWYAQAMVALFQRQ
ncbi:MAG: GDSL-type esterase/lipase family protein [Puia sp.]|nr:GDSL-type esterase/lipase family protein [Puia sp.]